MAADDPLAVVAVVFGAVIVLNLATLIDGPAAPVGLYTMIYVVLVPYALLRWGSGREVVIGLPIIVVAGLLGIASDYNGFGEAVAGFVFLMFPGVLGALVRFWTTARSREIDQARLREREQLARELHDTVAHHVSAMVVRAQAGRVVATSDPGAAVDALRVIEDEGSRTLAEMRTMVGVLRDRDDADLTPRTASPISGDSHATPTTSPGCMSALPATSTSSVRRSGERRTASPRNP